MGHLEVTGIFLKAEGMGCDRKFGEECGSVLGSRARVEIHGGRCCTRQNLKRAATIQWARGGLKQVPCAQKR